MARQLSSAALDSLLLASTTPRSKAWPKEKYKGGQKGKERAGEGEGSALMKGGAGRR